MLWALCGLGPGFTFLKPEAQAQAQAFNPFIPRITVNIYLMYHIMCYQISDCTVQSATVSDAMVSIKKVCRQLGSLITPSIKCPASLVIALIQNADQMTHEAQLPFKMAFCHTLGTTGGI